MPATEPRPIPVPEWYCMERETEKTIQKLKTIKELDYYLQNSDEFIRRLAILRLRELAHKEAVYTLKDLLDSPAETPGNKYISGWILSSLLKSRNDILFMNSRYGTGLNGSERYDELFPVISDKTPGAVNFNFGSSPSYSAFNLDNEDIVLERDVYFESGFDFWPWLKAFVATAAANLRNSILSVPAVAGRFLKNYITHLSERRKDKKLKSCASTEPGKSGGSYSPADSYYSLRKALYKK